MPHPSQTAPQPQVPVSRTGETVTVACRIPNGIVMQITGLEERLVDRPDGSQVKVKVAIPASERFTLNGCAKYRGGSKEVPHEIFQGAGLTFGVPADLFDAWIKANKDADFVKKGLVFAHRRDTRGQAVEHSLEASGMEPIDPNDKSKWPPEFRRDISKAA